MNSFEPTDASSTIPGPDLVREARAAVAAHLNHATPRTSPTPAGALAEPHPVFVTLRTPDGRLRGCIGTLIARCPHVLDETRALAREAAFADLRFPPVTPDELPNLRFEVSVVQPLEEVHDATELDPAQFGIVVSAADGRRGALLPEVDGIETSSQQLAVARRKGRICPGEPVRIQRFRVQKFCE